MSVELDSDKIKPNVLNQNKSFLLKFQGMWSLRYILY